MRAPLVVPLVRTLTGEERDELVLADLEVAKIQPVHAAPVQRIHLTFRVEIVAHFLVVDFQLHGIELEEGANIERQEYGHLGIGRKQQFLLENEEVLVQIDDLLLQRLHVAIKALAVDLCGRRRRLWRVGREHGAAQHEKCQRQGEKAGQRPLHVHR